MILSDKHIKKLMLKNLLTEEVINDIQLQPNSIDLTLGNTYKKLKANSHQSNSLNKIPVFKHADAETAWLVDPRYPMEYEEGTFNTDENGNEYYIIQPNEFVLMASNEIIKIPNGIIGLICGRSSIARLGLQTEQAGFIDAGFRGTLTLEIHNQNHHPIILWSGMRIAQVYFMESKRSDRLYGKDKNSKYNDQIKATESRIYLDPEMVKKL